MYLVRKASRLYEEFDDLEDAVRRSLEIISSAALASTDDSCFITRDDECVLYFSVSVSPGVAS